MQAASPPVQADLERNKNPFMLVKYCGSMVKMYGRYFFLKEYWKTTQKKSMKARRVLFTLLGTNTKRQS